MRFLRGLLVPLLVISVITALMPSASFATPSTTQRFDKKCKPKRGYCQPTSDDGVSIMTAANKIYNDRLVIDTDSAGSFVIGAAPDTTGNPGPKSWNLSFRWPNIYETSYTTIRIDGTDFVYGKSGTQREIATRIDPRTTRSSWQIGDIEVTQTLQIGANIHTGQKDAAIIGYTLRNTGASSKSVGTRVMIDTEINQKDGFPFRVPGSGIIANETEFTGANVPDVVLASATSMTDTQVTASTLKGSGATTPDRLVLANWSGLSAATFDYTVNPASSLTDDSAYAVYWNPKPLAAGETRSFVTLYGVGQATVDQAAPLALSVRGPAALNRTWNDYTPNPFDITATVSNTGTTATAGTQLTLNLPAGLTLVSGTATQIVGSVPAGQERQVSWKVHAPLQTTQATLSYSVTASATGVAAKTVSRTLTLPDLDATRRGPFLVDTAEYRYNPKTHTDVLSDRQTEIWARVYWPRDLSKGKYPLAVFLHGNHGTCGTVLFSGVRNDDRADYTSTGSCPAPYVVTPNHEGYQYLGDQLASWGYIVVSINANRGITAGSATPGDPTLVLARGRQVLKHLQLWQQWNTSGTADASFGTVRAGYTTFKGSLFKGKVDFANVGLMGHSRGGQGVRAAYKLFNDVGSPWPAKISGLKIKGIFEIAPTDVNNSDNPTLPAPIDANGTAWTVLLPMCDGDVINLQGVRAFDRMQQSTSEQPAFKGVYSVWGTNHNYYNTQWQISDSDGCGGTGHTAIFTPGETFGSLPQQQTGLASLLAFFRANVGDTQPAYNLNFNPLVPLPSLVSSVTNVDRGFSVTPNAAVSSVLEDFSKVTGTNTSSVPNESANVTVNHDRIALIDFDLDADGVCDDVTGDGVCDRVEHHDDNQRVGAISWTAAGAGNFFQTNWQAVSSGRDIADHATLDFRIARQVSALNPAGATNFSIRLVHGDGTLSDPRPLSAYTTLTGPVGVSLTSLFTLQHPILQTVRIPLKDFANAKLGQVRGVRLTFDGTSSGAIYVANMVFSRQFEPTSFVRQFVPSGATPFSVVPEQEAQPAPQFAAEIELYSPNGFPMRNALPVLHIGDQEFIYSRFKDGSTKTLVFGLTAEEFAATADGDPLTLIYGPYPGSQEWLFGRLNKNTRRYPEQLLATQQAARDLLTALRPQAATAQEQNQIDGALQRLDRTLARGQWRDSGHLEPSSADLFFAEAQQTVSSLQTLMRSNSGTIPSAVLRNFIRTRIVHVVRGLAALAIDEATAGQPGLDQARDALARGDDAALNDQFVSAVQHYRNAWRQAQRATP